VDQSTVHCPRGEEVSGVSFVNEFRGFTICEGEPATDMTFKTLFTTTDGGNSWTTAARVGLDASPGRLPVIGYHTYLSFPTESVGFLFAARNGLEVTTDGGRAFRQVIPLDDTDSVTGTSWLSASTGFVSTQFYGLLETMNGGGHWKVVFPGERRWQSLSIRTRPFQ
jgi:photosystem II stability/assembly factor-like uncharacterized protein